MKLISAKSLSFTIASVIVISLLLKKVHGDKLKKLVYEYDKLLEAERKFLEDLWYKEGGSTEMHHDSILANLFNKNFIEVQCTESLECVYKVSLTKAADRLIYNKSHIPV
jgi:hypothetical protein